MKTYKATVPAHFSMTWTEEELSNTLFMGGYDEYLSDLVFCGGHLSQFYLR